MHNTELLLDQGTAFFVLGQYRYRVALIRKRDWSAAPEGAFIIIHGNCEGVDRGQRIFWPGYVVKNTLHTRNGSLVFRPCYPRPGNDETFTFGKDEIKRLYWPLAAPEPAAVAGPDQLDNAAAPGHE